VLWPDRGLLAAIIAVSSGFVRGFLWVRLTGAGVVDVFLPSLAP